MKSNHYRKHCTARYPLDDLFPGFKAHYKRESNRRDRLAAKRELKKELA